MQFKNKIAILLVFLIIFLKNYISSNEIIFNFSSNEIIFNFEKKNYFLKKYQFTQNINSFDTSERTIKKEKNFDKLFLGIGVVTSTIGTGILLAGLINLTVTLDAVSINGVHIETNYNVYYSLIGIGGGLILTGIPFIIVSSIRIGIKNKKLKAEIAFKIK